MHFIEYLSPQATCTKVAAQSKKRALEIASEIAADILKDPKQVSPMLEGLLARERLGSTGIGHGVAIPHCRLANLQQPLAVLLQLEQGIDYNGLDKLPVDIVLALFVPTEATDTHLQLLAWIAEQFSKQGVLNRIRSAPNAEALYNIMANLDHE